MDHKDAINCILWGCSFKNGLELIRALYLLNIFSYLYSISTCLQSTKTGLRLFFEFRVLLPKMYEFST